MSVKLLTEHNLEFLSLKGGCTGSSESTLVKMPHCWKTNVTAHFAYSKFSYYTYQRANNKGADQSVQMGRLGGGFLVRMQQNQVFSQRGPYYIKVLTFVSVGKFVII